MNEVSLDQLSFDQFHALLNTKFRVDSGSNQLLELELIETTQKKQNRPGAVSVNQEEYEQFSLLFVGPADRFLEQKLYTFTHDQLGAFQLFIVPIRQNQDKLYYEAVFNRKIASR